MKPADPRRDYREFVASGYDDCAAAYNTARSGSDEHLLLDLPERLSQPSRVLDLGCGGLPVSRSLAAEHVLVGVDISPVQIKMAQRQAPGATFLLGDMMTLAFQPGSFDAIVSFYAIFHTPRDTHATLFQRAHKWLRPGGWLLASLGSNDEEGYTEAFFGVGMFWSNFAMPRYRNMLTECGFQIVDDREISHGYQSGAPPESHPLVLARKR